MAQEDFSLTTELNPLILALFHCMTIAIPNTTIIIKKKIKKNIYISHTVLIRE